MNDMREPRAGAHYHLTATTFLGQKADLTVWAQLTPAEIAKGASCSVEMQANSGALRIAVPAMRANEARQLARVLMLAADEADAIDMTPNAPAQARPSAQREGVALEPVVGRERSDP